MKEKNLPKKPLIRLNDIARLEKSKGYARLLLHRLARRGSLSRIAKGVYSSSKDAFSAASNIYYPSYVSFLSASYRHGLTETIPSTIFVAASKKHKPIGFLGYTLEFVPIRHLWGYSKESPQGEPVFLAEVEKLMIDAFLKPKAMGAFYEIERVFENSKEIDMEKLQAYLKKIGSNKLFRQVGFMLEKYKGTDISSLMPMNRNYYALNPSGKGGKINGKWRLFV